MEGRGAFPARTAGGDSSGPRHDNHVHTSFSGHSPDFPMSALAEAARLRGLAVSLREHAPLPPEFLAAHPEVSAMAGQPGAPGGLWIAPFDNLDPFLDEVAAAGLSLGFEVDALGEDWLSASERLVGLLRRRVAAHGLAIDCLNLSHHWPWDRTYGGLEQAMLAAGGPAAFLRSYFASTRAYAETGLFQAVSHLEAYHKFDLQASGGPPFAAHGGLCREETGRTLETLLRCGLALEYNTSGLASWGRPYLTAETARAAHRAGLRLVVGSDAHRPSDVGREFERWVPELTSLGVMETCFFRGGRAVPEPLRPA